MNCKPNDLAMIVRTLGCEEIKECLGMTVRVIEIDHVDELVGPLWRLEQSFEYRDSTIFSLADALLMSISGDADLPAVDKVVDLEIA